ncbi:MAG: hypothetical protein LBL66_04205 [Clostridiales bacterium]|nr:hypothetical protein [Clostridiales bacterium]
MVGRDCRVALCAPRNDRRQRRLSTPRNDRSCRVLWAVRWCMGLRNRWEISRLRSK